jgi:hypothetical protein
MAFSFCGCRSENVEKSIALLPNGLLAPQDFTTSYCLHADDMKQDMLPISTRHAAVTTLRQSEWYDRKRQQEAALFPLLEMIRYPALPSLCQEKIQSGEKIINILQLDNGQVP